MDKVALSVDTTNIKNRQLLGQKVLSALTKQGQACLDELIIVAEFFGLDASAIAQAIAGETATLVAA